MKRIFLVLSSLIIFLPEVEAEPVHRPHIEVELVSSVSAIGDSGTPRIGIRMKLADGWHVYWKYAGDSGIAPTLAWQLPRGASVGELVWPVPHRLPVGHLVNYGYEGELVLGAPLILKSLPAKGKNIEIGLRADWLVCMEECIPGDAELSLRLPIVSGASPPSQWAGLFDRALKNAPVQSRVGDGWNVAARFQNDRYTIEWTFPSGIEVHAGRKPIFFPSVSRQIENAEPQHYSVDIEARKGSLTVHPYRTSGKLVQTLSGVLAPSAGFSELVPGIEFGVPVADLPVDSIAQDRPASKSALQPPRGDAYSESGYGFALLLAFLGGVILNLMPCVFPVLSIKAVSLIELASKNRASVRWHGVAYSFGVIASFLGLAAILIVLRAQGSAFGWGFQLQSPPFVMSLCFVTFLIGLNLFGVFEIGGGVQQIASKASQKGGGPNSFMSGVLATLLATPCTAPFMGTAVAAALTMPTASALGVFASLGAGMAFPFLLVTWFPAILSRLPRPGSWMETFRQFMAFPMFATVLWLAWVLSTQVGGEYLLSLFVGLLTLLFGAWVFGRLVTPARSFRTRFVGRAFAIAAIVVASAAALPPNSPPGEPAARGATADQYGLMWQPYSKELIDSLRASGVPVYLDFTAAWCITCQVNKRVVFGSIDVRRVVGERGVALVRADWTSRDPLVTEALKSFGRAGVPFNVLYLPGKDAPIIFPAVMLPTHVIEALG